MLKILAGISLFLLIITAGCGLAIYFGGESFKDGIKGHIVLGILSVISLVALVVSIFKHSSL